MSGNLFQNYLFGNMEFLSQFENNIDLHIPDVLHYLTEPFGFYADIPRNRMLWNDFEYIFHCMGITAFQYFLQDLDFSCHGVFFLPVGNRQLLNREVSHIEKCNSMTGLCRPARHSRQRPLSSPINL
jgi:hypothetical protein